MEHTAPATNQARDSARIPGLKHLRVDPPSETLRFDLHVGVPYGRSSGWLRSRPVNNRAVRLAAMHLVCMKTDTNH